MVMEKKHSKKRTMVGAVGMAALSTAQGFLHVFFSLTI